MNYWFTWTLLALGQFGIPYFKLTNCSWTTGSLECCQLWVSLGFPTLLSPLVGELLVYCVTDSLKVIVSLLIAASDCFTTDWFSINIGRCPITRDLSSFETALLYFDMMWQLDNQVFGMLWMFVFCCCICIAQDIVSWILCISQLEMCVCVCYFKHTVTHRCCVLRYLSVVSSSAGPGTSSHGHSWQDAGVWRLQRHRAEEHQHAHWLRHRQLQYSRSVILTSHVDLSHVLSLST